MVEFTFKIYDEYHTEEGPTRGAARYALWKRSGLDRAEFHAEVKDIKGPGDA